MNKRASTRLLPLLVLTLALAVIFLLLNDRVAHAQQPTPSDDEVNAIARQLYCPVCENVPLDVCPTQACHQWRDLIRQMLAEGKTEAEIKQYFVENYGAQVLSEPPRQGLNWLAYGVPFILMLAGLFVLYRAYRMWKAAPQPVPPSAAAGAPVSGDDDAYIARIEKELKKRQ
jgi:cytochrome c-type biogenesis protein CcmH